MQFIENLKSKFVQARKGNADKVMLSVFALVAAVVGIGVARAQISVTGNLTATDIAIFGLAILGIVFAVGYGAFKSMK